MSTVVKKHFIGRDVRSKITANINGSSTQASTPTPTSPVAVVPLQVDSVSGIDISKWNLHGFESYIDTYNAGAKLITRNIGIVVFTGTESWSKETYSNNTWGFRTQISNRVQSKNAVICSHYKYSNLASASAPYGSVVTFTSTNLDIKDDNYTDVTTWKAWLAAQYAAGTPVIVYYPLATPLTEDAPPLIKTSITMQKIQDLPQEYDELEYVAFDSSNLQYLDTGFTPTNDYANTVYEYGSVSLKTTTATGDKCVGGIRSSANTSHTFKLPNTTAAKIENQSPYGQETTRMIFNPYNIKIKYDAKVTSGGQYYQCNDYFSSGIATAPSNVQFGTDHIYIGALDIGGTASWFFGGNIYSVYFKENGVYKFNLVPAKRKSDSVVGMYDLASGTFLTNKGSGTLTAGPVITAKIKQSIGETKTEVTD